MVKQTLLQKAIKSTEQRGRKARQYSLEEEELCLAWLNGEITITQVQHGLEFKSAGQVYTFLALCARQMFGKSSRKK